MKKKLCMLALVLSAFFLLGGGGGLVACNESELPTPPKHDSSASEGDFSNTDSSGPSASSPEDSSDAPGDSSTTSGDSSTSTALSVPAVTIDGSGLASWSAVANAVCYKYKLSGIAMEFTTATTSVQLTAGQSIQVKAVGDGVSYTDSVYSQAQTYSTLTALAAPVVTVNTSGMASWGGVANAVCYKYKLSGIAMEFTTAETSVQLTAGQSIQVKAVGDGVSYADSAYSEVKTFTNSTNPPATGREPAYLGILASGAEPKEEDGLPDSIESSVSRARAFSALSHSEYRSFNEGLAAHFADDANYLGSTLPEKSDYPLYSAAGQIVYIQIWLNNPEQHTILSMKLNGKKYQIGGMSGNNLSAIVIEEGGQYYSCVYAEVTVPAGSYESISYQVTDIEYVSGTYISQDGKEEFMNGKDTVSVGLPYNAPTPTVSAFTPTSLTYQSASATFTLSDPALVTLCGGWLGVAVYDGYDIVKNVAATEGENALSVDGLAENTDHYVYVYLYGDLHDGKGVYPHILYQYFFTTESVITSFNAQGGFYQEWGFEELGIEPDSGLTIEVNANLASGTTAEFDRMEIYKGQELVHTEEGFYGWATVKGMLARTQYLVKLYYSDETYTEHSVEQYVTTGSLTAPSMESQGNYAFLNGAALTFNAFDNGYLRYAIAKDLEIRLFSIEVVEARYAEYILELCDNPNKAQEMQDLFDTMYENGDTDGAHSIYPELNNYRWAEDYMKNGDYSSYGTDKAKWQALFDRTTVTYTFDDENMFKSNGTTYVIVRDYFTKFGESACGYRIMANVDFKDGKGFVKTELAYDSISIDAINSGSVQVDFDVSFDGLNVTVNPSCKINREEMELAVVSYEICVYTSDYQIVDTLYTFDRVNWSTVDEAAWINAYVAAMKGEAILPSEEEIIDYLDWRAIFEIINGLQIQAERDYLGGGSGDGTVTENGTVVDGTITGGAASGGGMMGGGEKNIANLAERDLLRALMQYEYPAGNEYSLKTQMLEDFRYDNEYYTLIAGCTTEEEMLEALIGGASNSTIVSVVNACVLHINHYMSWYGSSSDEIFLGFESAFESYIEDNSLVSGVNWQQSYRRIMQFEDFYHFYPFGTYDTVNVTVNTTGYFGGEYRVGVRYRFDGFAEGRYEERFASGTMPIIGPLKTPYIEGVDGVTIRTPVIDSYYFHDYHFEIELKDDHNDTIFYGSWEDYQAVRYQEEYLMKIGYKVRVRALIDCDESTTIYRDSAWSEWFDFGGIKLSVPTFGEYNRETNRVTFRTDGNVASWIYTVNDGAQVTISANANGNSVALSNGDVLRVKAIAPAGSVYLDSEWATYTCVDARPAIATPTNVQLTGNTLSWNMSSTENVRKYYIYVDGVKAYETSQSVSVTSFTLSELIPGASYCVQAITSNATEYRSSNLSAEVVANVTLANPKLIEPGNNFMVRWEKVELAESYYYKINADGVETLVSGWYTQLELTKLGVKAGDEIWVQARATGIASSEWVLLWTVTG